jgi:hypothetical protein
VTFYAAKYFAEGKIHGNPGDSFTVTSGKWAGTYTIGANREIVVEQPLQVTPENVKDNDF